MIREHTEIVKPPRALWVPFPLGRPLGVAEDPEFQTDVLRSALRLLETATAPVIEDYSREAPDGNGDGVWACSISMPDTEVSDLESALQQEVDLLTPWYEETRRRRGRSTVGMSGASPEQLDAVIQLIVACAEGAGFNEVPELASGPNWIHPMPMLLRYVVEDLRAFYQEAVTSRPGTTPPSQHDMHTWIFGETALGRALMQIGHQIAEVGDPPLLMMRGFIIPEGFWIDGPTWGQQPRTDGGPEAFRRAAAYLAGEQA